MIGLSGEIPLVSHSDVTSPFPPSGNGGYASNRDVLNTVCGFLDDPQVFFFLFCGWLLFEILVCPE